MNETLNITFKIATLQDVKGIISLCNECFDEKTEVSKAERVFAQFQNDPNQIYLIGVANGIIVAHTKITIIPTLFDGMDTYAILNHVCVKPDYRRHNIATKMLDVATEICENRQCIAMKLWSNNARGPAHACYRKYGFVSEDAKFFSKKL